MAHLFGKSLRERAIALIEIAHPDFREGLLAEAKALAMVPAAHKLGARGAYAVEEERHVTLKNGREALLRPSHGPDVTAMQLLFHKMPAQDAYMRFFRRLAGLTYVEAQRLCNVDFINDVAFVAVTGPRDNEELVGAAAYFLNPSNNLGEIAFMIAPDWQGTGLGSALQQRLKDYAVAHGVRGFVAEILQINSSMINLARRLGDITVTIEDGVQHVVSIFYASAGKPADAGFGAPFKPVRFSRRPAFRSNFRSCRRPSATPVCPWACQESRRTACR
jgi:RimJ/RimL family protein N-acetyltransferase